MTFWFFSQCEFHEVNNLVINPNQLKYFRITNDLDQEEVTGKV